MPALVAPLILGAGATAGQITAVSIGVNLALYAGTTAVSMLLQPSPPKTAGETGTKLSASFGGAVNQSIHVGEKETAGSLVYIGSWGREDRTPNGFLVRVYALSDRAVAGFAPYVLEGGRQRSYDPGETSTIDGQNVGHPVHAYDVGGQPRLWVKFHDGSQTVADGYLVAKFGTAEQRPWTANHIGRGRAYMIVTQKYDEEKPIGEIDVTAVIRNSYLYDLRSGTQVYGDSSTYAADPGNPVVVIYNILRGIYHNSEWLFGGQGWPETRFDEDSWVAAANKCDEDVAIAGGGTQKRFRVGAEIDLSEDPWSVVERCLKACNGRIVDSGGVFKIKVGGIGATDFSFTDDDIIVSTELTGRMFPERENIVNTVTGTYVEPANGGEVKAFKARFKQSYIDADGDVRKLSFDLDYVRDNRRAQRLATLALNDNRRFRSFVVAFWTQARKLEPGDVLAWTSDRYGFSAKKFIAGDVTLRNDGVVIVNLREADPADADWDVDQEDPYETGVFDDVDPAAQGVNVTIQASSITDDDNTTKRRPAIRISAALDDDFVDCKSLWVVVRKKNGDQKVIFENRFRRFFERGNADYGDITFTDAAFIQGREVQVKCRIVPWTKRKTSWSGWTDVTLDTTANPETSDDPPPALATTPTLELVTRTHRSGLVRQRLKVDLDLTGRDAKESYIVRVRDTTEDPDEEQRYETREFPYWVTVQDGHSYDVKVVPVSRYGVRGTASASATGVSMPIPKSGGNVPVVAGADITAGHRRIVLEWDDVDQAVYPDYAYTQVQESTSNSFPAPTRQNTRTTRGNQMVFAKLGNGVERFYRIRHKDSSDNPDGNNAGWSATLSATTLKLQNGDLDNNAVERQNIKDGEIVEDKLGANAVTRNKIKDGEVLRDKVADAAVNTIKIDKNSIEGRLGWKHKGKTVTWTDVQKQQKSKRNKVGQSVRIQNPNPAIVYLRVSFKAEAFANDQTNIGYAGTVKYETEFVIYSAPVNGSGAAIDGEKKEVYRKTLTSTLEVYTKYPDAIQTRSKIAKFTANRLVIMDMYPGTQGAAPDRRYWAEANFRIFDGKRDKPTHFSGTGYVKNVVIEGGFSKR